MSPWWLQFWRDAFAQGVGDLMAGVLLVILAVWAEAKMDQRRDDRRDAHGE
jgi:hypothetical protein